MIDIGTMQWILFWLALFSDNPGVWLVWIGALIFLK